MKNEAYIKDTTHDIHRIHRSTGRYTTVYLAVICDHSLSAKAKGLMIMILTWPAGHTFTVAALIASCKDGRDSVYAGLKELEEHGYITKTQIRDESTGKITGTHWDFYEESQSYGWPDNSRHEAEQTADARQITIDTLPTMTVGEEEKKKTTAKKPTRHKYGTYKHVMLTDAEYNAITSKYGKDLIDRAIELLDDYMETSGRKYKNYVLMLTAKWPYERAVQEMKKRGYRHADNNNNNSNDTWNSDGWCF